MNFKKMSRQVWIPAGLVTLALLTIAGALSVKVARDNAIRIQQATERAAQVAAGRMVLAMDRYQYGLRGARGAITVMGDHLSREAFRRYSATRDVNTEFPGARGFGFMQRVAPGEQAAFLATARADGLPGFALRQFSPHAGDRYIIRYAEPFERNNTAIGLDIASDPKRRDAADKAMRQGTVQLTAPITLVRDLGTAAQSFLMLLPVYQGLELPDDEAGREARLSGWTYTPLSAADVMAAAGLGSDDVRIGLDDVTATDAAIPFYRMGRAGPAAAPPAFTERTIFGRRWRLSLEPLEPFIAGLALTDPTFVFALGALLSVLTGLIYGSQRSSTLGQRHLSVERSRLAAIVDSSLDGIIGKDPDGIVRSWNRGAEHLFGWTAEQAIGRPLVELIVPEDLKQEEMTILQRIAHGQATPHFETVRRHRDGRLLRVSVSVAPIRNQGGQVIGASKTVRDISTLISAQKEIIKLNEDLERQVAQRTEELAALSDLQRTILNNAAYAVIAADTEGVITLFNPAAEAMLGYAASEMIGKATPAQFHLGAEIASRAAQLSDELGVTVQVGFDAFIAKARLELVDENEWTYIRKDGTPIPVLLAVSPLRGESGAITGYLGMALDISRQRADTRELELLGEHFKKAAEVAELGIWGWNLADDTLEWNERMFDIYSAPASLRGSGQYYDYWHDCVHPDDIAATEHLLQEAMAGRATFDITFRVLAPQGRIRYVHAAGIVILHEDGSAQRMVGINRDITTQLEHERTLSEARIAADAASAAKTAFLANMSHEIRSPMNAILGMLQLLQKTRLDERQFDYADKAAIAARSLLGILNDILDFSKVEAGKLTLDVEPLDLDRLFHDISVILSANVGNNEVEVLFDIDPMLPRRIVADRLRLQQVLLNLAGNAIKFCARGEIVLSARAIDGPDGDPRLAIAVRDTGIGIAAEHLDHIFEGFSQAEASTTRRFGGTGLGLAISKRLVSLMGGALAVRSTYGVGSTFSFDVPCVAADHDAPRARASSRAGLQRLRVLICDDNECARVILVNLVTSLGWDAVPVSNGYEALAELAQDVADDAGYDVVLIDWRMPGLDGWQTSLRIRAMLSDPAIPLIVMVTAHGREAVSQHRSEQPHVLTGLLVKPVTASSLFDCVADARAGGEASATPTAHPSPAVRLDGVRLLVVEDNLTNQQVARELLSSEGASVTIMDSGEGALALLRDEPTIAFDLVLMDVQMPGMDGYQTTREIRAHHGLSSLPIVAITANVVPSDKEAALAAGMNDHVGKPYDLDDLVGVIMRQLGREQATAAPASAPSSPPDAEQWPIAVTAALRRFGGNDTAYRRALRGFAGSAHELGKSLAVAIDARDIAWKRHVHTLKGLAATVGADDLAMQLAALDGSTLVESDVRWPAIAAAIDIACARAAAIVSDSDMREPPPPPQAASLASRGDIEELTRLLGEANMESVACFARLRPSFHQLNPTVALALGLAIDRLDFAGALATVDDFSQQS